MVEIYASSGFETRFCTLRISIPFGLQLNKYIPDLVLCSLDHLPSIDDGKYVSHNVHLWFESHNVNYIGSDPATIERALSKATMKRLWEKEGIRTPRFVVLLNDPRTRREAIEKLLKMNVFPYIIKPENLWQFEGDR